MNIKRSIFKLATFTMLIKDSQMPCNWTKFRHKHLTVGQQYVCFSAKIIGRPRKKKTSSETSDKECAPFDVVGSLEQLKSKVKFNGSKFSYVIDQNVAEKLASAIIKHRTNMFAPVLDVHAGPGLMSREFLKQGVSKVVALEINEDFSPYLESLKMEVGSDKFSFFKWHIVNLYLKQHSSPNSPRAVTFQKMESKVAESLQSSIPTDVDVPYSLVSIGGKQNNEIFVLYILRYLPYEDSILSRGRVEFFFLVHPRFKYKLDLTANIKQTDVGVFSDSSRKPLTGHISYVHFLLHLLYDIKVLDQIDAHDLCPPMNLARHKTNKELDTTQRLLVRLQLKKNIDDILPLHHHTPFLNFLHQLFKRKSTRIIPAMEMLIPGCGLRMLAEGFTMMDIVVRASPEEVLKLYKMMLEWPEYKSSPLHSHLMMKTTGSTEDAILSDDDEH